MKKTSGAKRKRVELPVIQEEEETPLVEDQSADRKPRWGGPYEFSIGPQPWQYIVSIAFLLAFFGSIVVITSMKYI